VVIREVASEFQRPVMLYSFSNYDVGRAQPLSRRLRTTLNVVTWSVTQLHHLDAFLWGNTGL
jgi:hypothetical protein